MKSLISIIVPVYNSEDYLEACIQSLRQQSYKKLELIFINDGSEDKSLSILEKYQRIDERIKVINQSNKGASAARNIGLDNANGEYIGFVDADDCVEKNMFADLFKTLKDNNTELAMCNFKIQKYDGSIELNSLPWENGEVLSYKKIREDLVPKMLGLVNEFSDDNQIYGSVCRCLYKRIIIQENKIKFPQEVKFMEDLLFNIKYLMKINKVAISTKFGYFYSYNKHSSTKMYMTSMLRSNELSVQILQQTLAEECLYERYQKYFNWRWRAIAIACGGNIFRQGNNKKFIGKYNELKEILGNKNIKIAFDEINVKKLSLKKQILYQSFKNRLVLFLYVYFFIAVKKERM